MRHRDSAGNEDLLVPGSVQWMTAGRGVIHSEMPEQQDGTMEGFQLWLNLPARSKMQPPWYRDIAPAEVPEWRDEGVNDRVVVRVLAGHSHGVAGAVQREGTEPLYLDLHLAAHARFEQPLPPTHNALLYVYRGGLTAGATGVRNQRMAIFANTEDSDGVEGDGRPRWSPRHPHRRPAAGRPDCTARALRHEHPRRTGAGRAGLPGRPHNLISLTCCRP